MEEVKKVLTVTIPAMEYETLKERSRCLAALEAGGVDNWEGYEPSLEMMEDD